MKQRILKALFSAYETYAEEQIRIVKSARKEDPSIPRRVTIKLNDFLVTAISLNPEAFPPDIRRAENSMLQGAFAKYDIQAEPLLNQMNGWTKELPSYKKHMIQGICVTTCPGTKDRPPRPEKNRIFFDLI